MYILEFNRNLWKGSKMKNLHFYATVAISICGTILFVLYLVFERTYLMYACLSFLLAVIVLVLLYAIKEIAREKRSRDKVVSTG